MGLKEDIEAARANRPEPVRQQVAVGEVLYEVEISRLEGLEWAGIIAECPPKDERGALLGYDANKAAVIACKRFSRLINSEGESMPMDIVRDEAGNFVSDPWLDLFGVLSGAEVGAIAAAWWGMNMHDPNERVSALKKASAAGS